MAKEKTYTLELTANEVYVVHNALVELSDNPFSSGVYGDKVKNLFLKVRPLLREALKGEL